MKVSKPSPQLRLYLDRIGLPGLRRFEIPDDELEREKLHVRQQHPEEQGNERAIARVAFRHYRDRNPQRDKIIFLVWMIAILILLILITAKSYGQITSIRIQNNGTPIANYTQSFQLNCTGGLNCSASGNLVTFNATAGGGSGTVTSVSDLAPLFVTATRTTTPTFSLSSAAANVVFGNCTGSSATPSYCALTGAMLPNPSATTLGGVQSFVLQTNKFISSISTSGVPSATQPDFSNLSGSATNSQLPVVDLAHAGNNTAGNTGANGKLLIGNGTAFVEGDPIVQGTQAPASTTIPNPMVSGGSDYGGTAAVRAWKVDSGGLGYIAIPGTITLGNLPQQPFLNVADFSDVTAASPTRGDIISAQGASPKWNKLAVGTASQTLHGGTEPAWSNDVLLNGTIATDTAASTVNSGDIVIGNATPKWVDLASPTTTGTSRLVAVPVYQAVPAAPSLTVQNGGGTIAQGTTVFVRIKLKYTNGDTGPSTETSIVASAGNGCTASCTVTVALNAAICQPTANGQTATGCDVYDSTTTGTEKLQAASANCQNIAANCVIGTVGAGATFTTLNNATVVQPVQWNQEKVRIACDYLAGQGASAFQKIQAAIDDIQAPGGTVDARCFGSSTQFNNLTQLVLGDPANVNAKRITLLIDPATDFEIGNLGANIPVIKVCGYSSINGGSGSGHQSTGPLGGFVVNGTQTIDSIVAPCSKTGNQQSFNIQGAAFKCNGSTVTVSTAAFDLEAIGDGSQFANNVIENCSNTTMVWFKGQASIVGPVQVLWLNNWVNCSGAAGCTDLKITGAATGGNPQNIQIIGGSITDPPSGGNIEVIDGLGNTNSVLNITHLGTYFESTTAGVVDAIKIRDASGIKYDSVSVGGPAATNMFTVSESATGLTHDLSFTNINNTTATNFLNDTINTQTVAGTGSYDGYFSRVWIDRSVMPRTVRVTADVTNATTTFANITGLTFLIAASKNYKLNCDLIWQTNTAATGGLKLQVTGPASPTNVLLTAEIWSHLSANSGNAIGVNTVTATAFSSSMAGNGATVAAATNYRARLEGLIENGTTAGTAQVQFAEIGTGTGTIKRGSSCVATEVR